MKGTIMSEFKNHMFKKLKNLVLTIASVAVGYMIVTLLIGGEATLAAPIVVERAPVENAPVHVLGQHKDECWTMNDQPKAELPGAAIVQFTDGRTIYTKKHILVDAAFNEALAAAGYGDVTSDKIDVIALCV